MLLIVDTAAQSEQGPEPEKVRNSVNVDQKNNLQTQGIILPFPVASVCFCLRK
jgi:hypothetical protein